ncbi:MAG: HEXXH motif-containing putative peptide modification protein [Bdellovibrionota bacterium]
MIFSPPQYRRLKSRIRTRYSARWKSIRKNFARFPASELKTWIKNHESELSTYTNFNWFYLDQLETFFFLKSIDPRSGNQDGLSKDEDLIFDIWNDSEFADVFLKSLNKGKSVQEASLASLKPFELHLLTLGKRHVEKIDAKSTSYRIQSVLGERLRDGKISPLLGTTLHLDGKDLDLLTHSLKEMKLFSQRIDLAHKLIRRFSPSSWDRFAAFTDKVIPIRNKEFVSYSHQEFPSVSMINLYDRDFVDLMDDLLHENGHHHLNHYLNLEKLIDEPADLIYYSPWRRTARPLRGIFHAYFTFFWAFKLFSDLANNDLANIWYEFTPAEKEKIYWRAVEEFHMLKYSFEDLKWAKKKKLISDTGWEIIAAQQKELLKFSAKIPKWERKLTTHKKDLQKLKTELRTKKKKYSKT